MFFLEVTLHTAIFYLYGKTQGRMKSDGELVFNWDEQNKGVIKDKLKQFPRKLQSPAILTDVIWGS